MSSGCTNCCDKCQTCINCDSTCDVMQNFCGPEGPGQLASANGMSYSFGPYVRDDIIITKLPQQTMNDIGAAVEKIANFGNTASNPGWTWTDETRDFIYADKTNELVAGIDAIGGGTTCQSQFVSSGRPNETWPAGNTFIRDTHIVFASYFKAIADAVNNMQLRYTACDTCNTACNVTCNTCNSCNTCEGCNTCQHSPCYGSCHGST